MKHLFAYFFILIAILSSCGNRTAGNAAQGDTLRLKYAQNITIVRGKGFTKADLTNPWKTDELLHSYVLVPQDAEIPENLPDGTLVRVPLQRAVVYTSVHCGLIDEMGAADCIGGVCDLQYIHTPAVVEGCRTGRIADIGNSADPSVERIIDLAPDALIASPFENSGGYGAVEKLNTPIIECADYMEVSALARAEWIRFYGILFGCEVRADSLFAQVEREYLSLKELAATAQECPKLMCDMMYGGTWYVPGGKSHSGKIYTDAHARFINADNDQSGSIPMPFETVYDMASDADIWLIKYNQEAGMTYDQMQTDYAPYAGFKAFQQRRIYGCNTSRSDFYDVTSFHPELILRDLIIVLHPELLPGELPRYFFPLNEK